MHHLIYFSKELLFIRFFLILLLSIQSINTCWASDLEKEKYWKTTITENLKIGEAIELKAAEKSFFAIYTQQNLLKERGSVIILHGKAAHPDWKDVIRPLRIHLTDNGWNTLSVQMPLRKKPLTTKEEMTNFIQQGATRIDSTMAFLKKEKAPAIFLLVHGENAMIALDYLKNNPKQPLIGLVLISMPVKVPSSDVNNSLSLLSEITLPILDIYAGKDLELVQFTAHKRQSTAKRSGNSRYLQQKINNADHSFSMQTETLIKRIHSWMLATSVEQ